MTWVNEYIDKVKREGLFEEMKEDYFKLTLAEFKSQW
jgi:hypothetical protein